MSGDIYWLETNSWITCVYRKQNAPTSFCSCNTRIVYKRVQNETLYTNPYHTQQYFTSRAYHINCWSSTHAKPLTSHKIVLIFFLSQMLQWMWLQWPPGNYSLEERRLRSPHQWSLKFCKEPPWHMGQSKFPQEPDQLFKKWCRNNTFKRIWKNIIITTSKTDTFL